MSHQVEVIVNIKDNHLERRRPERLKKSRTDLVRGTRGRNSNQNKAVSLKPRLDVIETK